MLLATLLRLLLLLLPLLVPPPRPPVPVLPWRKTVKAPAKVEEQGASRAAEAVLCLWFRADRPTGKLKAESSNPMLLLATPHSYSSGLLSSAAKWQLLVTMKTKRTAGDAGHGDDDGDVR